MEQPRNIAGVWRRLFGAERWRRLSLRLLALLVGLALGAAGCEEILERRARARLTAGDTFVAAHGANIRYRLLGKNQGGAPVVFLTGIGGSIEQIVHVQRWVAESTQTLSYDRGGYGFSSGSGAHTAAEQAAELFDLLDALRIKGPVVLVGFSSSASIARLFLARYPERTQGLYFVEPYLPEVAARLPAAPSRRRDFARWIAHDLFMSTFGLLRAKNRLADFDGPADPVEQRAEEILQSRHHFWAMTREWYAFPVMDAEALSAPVGSQPIVIFFSAQPDGAVSERVYEEFVRRSPRGKLVRLPNYDHSKLLTPGPALDQIGQGIVGMATGPRP